MTPAERTRLWRLAHPGSSTKNSKAWREANPEKARQAELRKQQRRFMAKMQYGPRPKFKRAVAVKLVAPQPIVVQQEVEDFPVVQRWLTQEEWNR